MKKRHSFLIYLHLALTAIVITSCGADTTDMGKADSPVLSLTEDTVMMHTGETHRLSLTYGISGVEWSSEHDSVATVDFIGTVTAVRPGETTVTATRQPREDEMAVRTASCLIRVTD